MATWACAGAVAGEATQDWADTENAQASTKAEGASPAPGRQPERTRQRHGAARRNGGGLLPSQEMAHSRRWLTAIASRQ